MKVPYLPLVALLLFLAAATGYGQTVKSLGYNTTNGQIVYGGTNSLTFTNAFTFSTNTLAASVRTNLGLGAWATLNDGASVRSENVVISDGEQLDYIQFTAGEGVEFFGNRASQFRTALGLGFTALTNTNADDFRSAIALPWSGLTNTNAATFQAALFPATNAAPTNTNAPVPDAWLDVQVGTNTYKLPLWQ
jgi:hypothetical protein